jgi:hypothetical protein
MYAASSTWLIFLCFINPSLRGLAAIHYQLFLFLLDKTKALFPTGLSNSFKNGNAD